MYSKGFFISNDNFFRIRNLAFDVDPNLDDVINKDFKVINKLS